ncbi:MAG: hypothetical protein Q4C91_20775 [Eubacteriales bacterium]|nr:hypothetical protein [Eubacteriales bacterium]
MQKNETVLTPVYRYVLEVLESKTIDAAEKIRRITGFKNYLQGDVSLTS